MTDLQNYQASHNGPLTQEAIDFLDKVRVDKKWSYDALASAWGLAAPSRTTC